MVQMEDNYVRVVVPIDVWLSADIGKTEAFLITQIDYWTRKVFAKNPDEHGKKHFKVGRWWVYNTVQEWEKQFQNPYSQNKNFSKNTIIRAFDWLEENDLIYIGNFNPEPRDQTKWYSVNYETLFSKFPYTRQTFDDGRFPITQNGKMGEMPKMGECQLPKMGEALPKNTIPKNTTKNNLGSMEFSEKNSARLDFGIVERQIRKVCKDKELSQEDAETFTEVFRYFYEQFERYTGREHTRLSNKNISSVIDNLRYSEDEDSHTEFCVSDAGIDTVKRMIDNYFTEQPGLECDSILHFTSAGILIHRYLEVMRDNDELPFD